MEPFIYTTSEIYPAFDELVFSRKSRNPIDHNLKFPNSEINHIFY